LAVAIVVILQGCFENNSEVSPPALGDSTTKDQPLTAGNDTLDIAQGGSGQVAVLKNDADDIAGGILTVVAFDAVSAKGGTVVDDGNGRFTYTPPSDTFTGEDSFTYTVQDADGNKLVAKVTVVVDDSIIDVGRNYYDAECGICHSAGQTDTHSAFNASDLALTTVTMDNDLSQFGGPFDPPLMGFFTDIPQKQVDGLKAFLDRVTPL